MGGSSKGDMYINSNMQLKLSGEYTEYFHKLEKAFELKDCSEIDKIGNKVITKERNTDLYDIILDKLSYDAYSSKKNSIVGILKKGKETFKSISVEEQVNMLLEIINNLYGKKQTVDLEKIGGSKHSGLCTCSREVSKYSEAKLLHKSATGLYSKEINLLEI